MRILIALAAAVSLSGCVALASTAIGAATNAAANNTPPSDQEQALAGLLSLERQSGGRIGAVLLDDQGRSLVSYRGGDRMAFCSTFKLPLAGAAYKAAEDGKIDLDAPVSFSRSDFPGYQPIMERKLEGETGRTTLREAIAATMRVSDNMAANLIIDALGGPPMITAQWRAWGDSVSRLDRKETALNENALGDQRDTSTPFALADLTRRLVAGELLDAKDTAELTDLTSQSTTGLKRVRGGLPEGWAAGDKTGTCKSPGMPDRQHNDIGWFRGPDGRNYYFAVMIARPTVDFDATDATHAHIGRLFANHIAN